MAELRSLAPEPMPLRSPRLWAVGLLVVALGLVPVYAAVFGQSFYLTLFGRILIYAIAASSLNLLIGYAGLVSFGHALFFGLGAYAVGILGFHGIYQGWLHLGAAIAAAAAVGVLTGLIALRTAGIGFIMITLAFAQMFYFLGISLKQYGGDDGIQLLESSRLWPLDLSSKTQLYYLSFAILVTVMYLSWRLAHSRFGYTLRGIKANERRMLALGYRTLRFKLAIYAIAACVASVAGFLLANLTSYASPSYAAWTISGELIVIVVLGGMGTVAGPLVGALALLLLEEWLAALTQHWMAPLGVIIVAIVLLAKRGLYGSFRDWAMRVERSGK